MTEKRKFIPRSLPSLIEEMLTFIPEEQEDFRIDLGVILGRIRYAAPETLKTWWDATMRVICRFVPEKMRDQVPWQFRLYRLWMGNDPGDMDGVDPTDKDETFEVFSLWWHTVYHPADVAGLLGTFSADREEKQNAGWWLTGAFEGRLRRRPTEDERRMFGELVDMTSRATSHKQIILGWKRYHND